MVVVTGAGAGIGQGNAQAFHAAGGRVALADLRKDAVEHAAAGLGGERTFAGVVDVRTRNRCRLFFAAAERALGPVTIGRGQRRHLSELPGARHDRSRNGTA